MSRVLYFDCFSGISGDMVLGALLDAGLPLEELTRALGSLAMAGYHVHAERVLRAGVSATKFDVHEDGHQEGARLKPRATHDHSETTHDDSEASHDHSHATHDHSHLANSTHPTQHHSHPASPTHPTQDHSHPTHPTHAHRSLPEIFGLIDRSGLSAAGRERAKAMFQRLAEAEAAIHQMPVERVHLHEVGALDSIIDIVGAVFALEWFGVDRILASPLNVGGGMVDSAHGRFPVPAPATVRLLGTAPIYNGYGEQGAHELVTPTGALIVSTYASAFGPIPQMIVDRVGYGAGSRDFQSTPNVLRVMVGQAAEPRHGDRVTVVECEIDDMNPQIFSVVMERLYAAGALEVFYVPVQMKKNRPGTLLTVVAAPDHLASISDIIFRETTTIGLRHYEVERECLRREIVSIDTTYGAIRFKVAWRDGRVVNAVPEFEDCARAAREHDVAVKQVQAIAIQAYGRRQP